MANSMKNRCQFLVCRFQFAVCCLLLPVFAMAEALTDPTRPPASISAPAVQAGVPEAEKTVSLQSILIGKNRRAAIIDGKTVELGGRIGDAKLIEVSATYVVLRTAHGRQVLKLFPDIKITNSNAALKKVKSGEKK